MFKYFQSLAEYFQKNNVSNKDNKNQLRTSVENEYRKWKSIVLNFKEKNNINL